MSNDARLRIDKHRLMRTPVVSEEDMSIATYRMQVQAREMHAQRRLTRRVLVHLGAFVLAYIFTAGTVLVGVLLWVRPDTLLLLVMLGILASGVFIACFAGVRMLVLHHIFDEYPDKEEDPGMTHHLGKSVAYAFLALIVAVLLTGFLINLSSASSDVSLAYNLPTYQPTS
ncbi:MAG: hypothetical protein KBD24_03640 [Candidatus Pacebacteria bacterium]|nr:hypothetical protein [Candidatus Paceibacterota bacterium]